jgi:hypothetical protein
VIARIARRRKAGSTIRLFVRRVSCLSEAKKIVYFDTTIRDFMTYKRSWKTDETVLRVHVLPQLGRLYLDEVTPASIAELMASMRSDNYASGTVANVIVILRYC